MKGSEFQQNAERQREQEDNLYEDIWMLAILLLPRD